MKDFARSGEVISGPPAASSSSRPAGLPVSSLPPASPVTLPTLLGNHCCPESGSHWAAVRAELGRWVSLGSCALGIPAPPSYSNLPTPLGSHVCVSQPHWQFCCHTLTVGWQWAAHWPTSPTEITCHWPSTEILWSCNICAGTWMLPDQRIPIKRFSTCSGSFLFFFFLFFYGMPTCFLGTELKSLSYFFQIASDGNNFCSLLIWAKFKWMTYCRMQSTDTLLVVTQIIPSPLIIHYLPKTIHLLIYHWKAAGTLMEMQWEGGELQGSDSCTVFGK